MQPNQSWMYLTLLVAACWIGPCTAKESVNAGTATMPCQALSYIDFSRIPDAPTQLTGAVGVDETKSLPAHCRIKGYVAPSIGIEMLLPASNWNGKFFAVGCGGWCGATLEPQLYWPQRAHACDDALRRGYACIANDSGHKSSIADLKWAYNDMPAAIDYGYRATHLATVAGKAIAEKFYGQAPAHSYFMGCSGGGREAFVEAQRFPWDFDGVVAGAPAIDVEGGMVRLLWTARSISGALNQDNLKLVHDAVIAKCDLNDGVKDGLIGDPRQCKFDPTELICKNGGQAECLTPSQAAAIAKIYGGPVDSHGTRVYRTGSSPGTEAEWPLFGLDGTAELFRYMGLSPSPGPTWSAADFDFDRDYRRLGIMESLFDATNPDLRKFKAAGGKLIAWHGWSDHLQDGTNTVDYYQTVERTMGGADRTRDFFRLYMLPGVGHCGGGSGADAVDYITAIESWVEGGKAPDRLESARLKPGSEPTGFPLDPAAVSFTRPIYPFPTETRYLGRGDPNAASSFGPVTPK